MSAFPFNPNTEVTGPRNGAQLQWKCREKHGGCLAPRWRDHSLRIDKDAAKERVQEWNESQTLFDYRIKPCK